MMDYEFLDKCTDPEVIRAVLRKLRSGEEGHYPDLTNVSARNGQIIAVILNDSIDLAFTQTVLSTCSLNLKVV